MFGDENIDFSIFENEDFDNYEKLRKDYKKINKDPAKKELVERILKKDNLLTMDDDDLVEEIKRKFTDKETVRILYTWLSHRLTFITDKAQTFRKNILSTYSYLPPNKIMKKAMKYAKRLHFTPTEFDIFRKMFMMDYQTPITSHYEFEKGEFQNSGAMATLLNYQPKEAERGKLNFESSEAGVVDNIIKSAIATEELFYYCVSNSLTYQYSDDLYNEIKVKKDYKITDCVPPVIAAMFIPKIPYFDLYMLQTNIGKFIQHSYEHKKLTGFENMLKLNLASDSSQYSDQTGKLISPLKDLQIRASIQQSLWKLVLFLRNKQSLNCDCTKFYNLISMYAPDLFVSQRYKNQTHQDSINIITRLFHVFSLYPLKYKQTINFDNMMEENQNKQIFYRPSPNSNIYISKTIKGLNKDQKDYLTSEFTRDRNASFIFIRPQKVNNQDKDETTVRQNFKLTGQNAADNNFYSETQKHGIIGITSDVLTFNYSEHSVPFKSGGKAFDYSDSTGAVVVLVLRNVNASNFKIDNADGKYQNELNAIYKYSSFKNLIVEYDTTKVLFSDELTGKRQDQKFKLQSVVLNSIYENPNSVNNPSSNNKITLKTKGSPFCIVATNSDKSLIYHPYNFDLIKYSGGSYINGPFNNISLTFGNSSQPNDLTKIIEDYGEIFIYSEENFQINP